MNKSFIQYRYGNICKTLLVYFIILIMFSTSIVGIFSSLYFSSRFNEKLKKISLNMLLNIENKIKENVLYKANKIYFDITCDNYLYNDIIYFFNSFVRYDSEVIINSVLSLRSIITRNDEFIDSIYLYSKKNDMVLSSEGFSFLENNTYLQELDMTWYNIYNSSNSKIIWINYRIINKDRLGREVNNTSILSFIRSYPFLFPSNINDSGIVAINIKESYIQNILKSYTNIDNCCTFIINEDGSLISCNNMSTFNSIFLDSFSPSFLLKLVESDTSDILQINGHKYLVNYLSFNTNTWKLISIIPYEYFYNESYTILNYVIISCVVTIFLGFILSCILTSKIYNPIFTTFTNALEIFGGNRKIDIKGRKNECAIINDAINHLSVKVHELKSTLDNNMPLIKHNLIARLIYGNIQTEKEMDRLLTFFGDELEGPFFIVIIIKLNENIFKSLSMESGMSVKYNIINYIESLSKKTSNFIAINLYEQNDKIAILHSSNKVLNKTIVNCICMDILTYIEYNLKIPAVISISTCVKGHSHINEAFINAMEVIRYSFFLPNLKILYQTDLQKCLASTDEIPEKIILSLESALNSRNIEMVERTLNNLVQLIQKGNYSGEACYLAMRNIIHSILQYAKDIDIEIYNKIRYRTQNTILLSNFITDFINIIKRIVEDIFEYQEQKNANRNSDKIEQVKTYIEKNIFSDLSLDIVADMIAVTPQYLCKLFKEHTGINYKNYLTRIKMEKAAELIKSTNKPINEIAEKLGYNNPSYFIQKFREIHGQTPGDFRKKCL
ncbi:MAG: helix-turn-helix domain-containing protein [Firmicutes bacterium]|nr:helix-turn-helix domain-containing protein [Bacillota bacterium]